MKDALADRKAASLDVYMSVATYVVFGFVC